MFANYNLLKNFLDKDALKDALQREGQKAARDLARRNLTARFKAVTEDVEVMFLEDGWTLQGPPDTEDGAKAFKKRSLPYQAVLADLQFRLWDKGVFEPFLGDRGSGHMADAMRDAHEHKVYAVLMSKISEKTSLQDVINAIITVEVDICF